MLVRHKTGEGVDLAELLLAMTGFAAGCFGALLLLLGARIHDREAVARRWTVRDGPRR